MALSFQKYAAVVLDVAVGKALDYGVPDGLLPQVKRGVRVEVPIRGHIRKGTIVEIKSKTDFPVVQPLKSLISDKEFLTDDLFVLALWIARYYYAPLHRVFKTMLPASIRSDLKQKQQLFIMRRCNREKMCEQCTQLRKKFPAQSEVLDVMIQVEKGILLTELLERTGGSRSPVETLLKKGILLQDIVRIDRSPLFGEEYFPTKPKQLNPSQEEALRKINRSLDANQFETHLLHGVTGSGKTEVYLQALERTLESGKTAIILVPEIALTAQTIERFRSRSSASIAILHHRLSHGERRDAWHQIREGKARIIIGARSAIFCPAQNLGLIIVDEEHEQSYKQSEETPYYHARDVAVMRGNITKSTVILGSATPSLESYANAKKEKYTLSALGARADQAAMPEVTIVDMLREYAKAKGYTTFSDPLLTAIKIRLEAGEQTILFLNRRGYHTTLMCKGCGHSLQCAHCDIALTYHQRRQALECHLCGFSLSPPPKVCPSCHSPDPMQYRGVGTEQVEKALHAIFPEIRTIRMDADTTKHKGSHQKLLRQFGSGKADVLIGTQMVAKGHHFPQVTLVGVLNSDGSLNIPDFRASETVFQLITQVAGRAGRGAIAGEVIIQTCMPENTTIQLAAMQDYPKFFEQEIAVRKLFSYPPHNRMAKIVFTGTDPIKTQRAALQYFHQLQQHLPPSFMLNPVVASGHAKVKDRYRFQFIVRGPNIFTLNNILQTLPPPKNIKLSIDIDPLSTYF